MRRSLSALSPGTIPTSVLAGHSTGRPWFQRKTIWADHSARRKRSNKDLLSFPPWSLLPHLGSGNDRRRLIRIGALNAIVVNRGHHIKVRRAGLNRAVGIRGARLRC